MKKDLLQRVTCGLGKIASGIAKIASAIAIFLIVLGGAEDAKAVLSVVPKPRPERDEAPADERVVLRRFFLLDRFLPRAADADPAERDLTSTSGSVEAFLEIDESGRVGLRSERPPGRAESLLVELVEVLASPRGCDVAGLGTGAALLVSGTREELAAVESALEGVARLADERSIVVTGKVLRFPVGAAPDFEALGLPALVSKGAQPFGAVALSDESKADPRSRDDVLGEVPIDLRSKPFQRWITEGRNLYHYVADYEVEEVIDRGLMVVPVLETTTDGISLDVVPVASGETVLLDVRLRLSTLHRPTPTFITNLGKKDGNETVTVQLPETTEIESTATVHLKPGRTVVLGPGPIPASSVETPDGPRPANHVDPVPIEEIAIVVLTARIEDE